MMNNFGQFILFIGIIFNSYVMSSHGAEQRETGVEEWNRIDIQQINRERPHANNIPYVNVDNSPWHISLNGLWKFNWSEDPSQRPRGFWQQNYDVKGWEDIPVPSNWELQGYGRPYYVNSGYIFAKNEPNIPKKQNHVGSYRRYIDIPDNWSGREVFINFGAVESAFYLWVNGRKVGYSQGAKTPGEFNLSDYVKPGKNLIAVEVYRWNDGSYLEDVDAWRLSGISRDVTLYSTPKGRIRDYFIQAGLGPNYQGGRLNLDIHVTNHSGKNLARQLLVRLERNSQTLVQYNQEITVSADGTEQVIKIARELGPVDPWSDETPNLYDLTLQLQDHEGIILQEIDEKVGFRTVEIIEGQLKVNGKAIKLRGVNRHEHDMKTGHVISKESMEQDMALLKQFNVNAVRTSHYPNDPYWYHLADKYGLYIVDEAYVESHGYLQGRVNLAKKPEWELAHLTRMKAMVERDKNHPSVIIWSLGNESAGGPAFQKMYSWTKARDTTRPVQYQAAGLVDYTDIYVPFYRSPEETQRYLDGEPQKPLIHAEYAHAMGNSLGGFQKHWDVIYNNPMAQGGFIWDWADQGILQKHKDGRVFFAYGGDFGPQQVDGISPPKKLPRGNFLANGILQSDRTPNPHAWEMKKVFQPLLFSAIDLKTGKINILSRRDFADTSDLDFFWTMMEDGKKIATRKINIPLIKARQNIDVDLGLPVVNPKWGSEYFVTINARLNRTDHPLIKQGHRVAWEQFKLPIYKETTSKDGDKQPSLMLDSNDEYVDVKGKNFHIRFSKSNGMITSLKYDDVEMIRRGLKPNFWRPMTDNDIGGKIHISSKIWKKLSRSMGGGTCCSCSSEDTT